MPIVVIIMIIISIILFSFAKEIYIPYLPIALFGGYIYECLVIFVAYISVITGYSVIRRKKIHNHHATNR